jgi:hypothetical protein
MPESYFGFAPVYGHHQWDAKASIAKNIDLEVVRFPVPV